MNQTDGEYSALHYAVKYCRPENVKLLVEHGAGKCACPYCDGSSTGTRNVNFFSRYVCDR